MPARNMTCKVAVFFVFRRNERKGSIHELLLSINDLYESDIPDVTDYDCHNMFEGKVSHLFPSNNFLVSKCFSC